MNKLTSCFVAVCVLVAPLTGQAQQTCRSESEIPSSTPSSRFTDHADGTVTDGVTGLMWARCAAGQWGASCTGSVFRIDWQSALNHAAGSTLAGHTDWRLPTVRELNSIVEQRCISPAINAAFFPNTAASGFWSASPSAYFSSNAWAVYFSYGWVSQSSGRDARHAVRLVRAGQ